MFFQNKMCGIGAHDKVLEIGPGATPHHRSDAFLELVFDTAEAKKQQRGGGEQEANFGQRPVHYYEGECFPFVDKQFDYVICSHVIEHVPDPTRFLAEVFRVGGGRGYLEYPLMTYEYLYDFDVHLNFVKFDAERRILRYLPKRESPLSEFSPVTDLFRHMLSQGWDDLCAANKPLFFEGFEFVHAFSIEKTNDIALLLPPLEAVAPKGVVRNVVTRLLNRAAI